MSRSHGTPEGRAAARVRMEALRNPPARVERTVTVWDVECRECTGRGWVVIHRRFRGLGMDVCLRCSGRGYSTMSHQPPPEPKFRLPDDQ